MWKWVIKKRVIKDFFIFGFALYGALWTLIESVDAFFQSFKLQGLTACLLYILVVLISAIVGLYYSWPRNSIEIDVPNSDSKFKIKFGNLFDHHNGIAIPVNEYFDSELGDHVSEVSLHGQFIKKILGGQSGSFEDLTSEQLRYKPNKYTKRSKGRNIKYPIGTTICISVNDKKYFLFALARTDINTLKASATVHELWEALAGLWECIRNYSNGQEIGIPLAGSGLSGVGLPTKNLIYIIITSFFYYTKKHKIANGVILVLPNNLMEDVDLLDIKRNWSEK